MVYVDRMPDGTTRLNGGSSGGPPGAPGADGTDGVDGLTPSLRGTSTSSVAIGTGSKTFAISPAMNVAFPVGTMVRATGATSTNYMTGLVTAATTTSVTLNVTETGGVGTFASWTLTVSGLKGPTGDKGSRWGFTPTWVLGPTAAVEVSFEDGLPPRTGDLVISTNGFGIGDVYVVTAPVDTTHADLDITGSNLRGAQGIQGDPGATGTRGRGWFTGTGAPPTGGPAGVMIGDLYLDGTNGDFYEAYDLAGDIAWSLKGNLKGPKGDKGDKGDPGPAGGVLDAWPIDSVFIGYTSTSPATLLGGGTWTQIGQGRMLVGQSSTDTDFDTVGEVGGEKTHTLTKAEIPPHVHAMDHDHPNPDIMVESNGATATGGTAMRVTDIGDVTGGGGVNGTLTIPIPNLVKDTGTGSTAGLNGDPHNNMPPYLVVYFWRRTA